MSDRALLEELLDLIDIYKGIFRDNHILLEKSKEIRQQIAQLKSLCRWCRQTWICDKEHELDEDMPIDELDHPCEESEMGGCLCWGTKHDNDMKNWQPREVSHE